MLTFYAKIILSFLKIDKKQNNKMQKNKEGFQGSVNLM